MRDPVVSVRISTEDQKRMRDVLDPKAGETLRRFIREGAIEKAERREAERRQKGKL